ncbi:MAG: hypothetical protein Cons2KO_30140 [Congregibacter sp.]
MVRPYKGYDAIVRAVRASNNGSVRLLISGSVQDESYRDELLHLAEGDPRIQFDWGFSDEQELADQIAAADVVACPFSNTLTSGSVLLAMTLGKALLLPESATSLDCLDSEGILVFADDRELVGIVNSLSHEDLAAKGRINLKRASLFDWRTVGASTTDLYSRVL